MFIFLSLFFCCVSFSSIDPLKRSLYLVLSLLCISPIISFFSYVWFSYFICLIFLSGVFVIVVYFSSIIKFFNFNSSFDVFVFFFSLFTFSVYFSYNYGIVSLNTFYYSVYFVYFVYIIFSLLFFLNFVSYFLNFSRALRIFC